MTRHLGQVVGVSPLLVAFPSADELTLTPVPVARLSSYAPAVGDVVVVDDVDRVPVAVGAVRDIPVDLGGVDA